jgi:hypothetical protein
MNINVRTMVLSVMKRYQQDEYIFPMELYDYITDLLTLEKLYIETSGEVSIHKSFLNSLISLETSYKVLGNRFLSEDRVKPLALKIMGMYEDYKDKKLSKDFFQSRKNHYSRIAFSRP